MTTDTPSPAAAGSAGQSRSLWQRLLPVLLLLLGLVIGAVAGPMAQTLLLSGAPDMMREVGMGDGRLREIEQAQAELGRRLDVAAAGGTAGLQGERIARLEGRIEGLFEQQNRVQAKIDGVALESTRVSERMDDVLRQSSATSASAATDAQRAHAVLLVTAVRRLLEAGRPLGLYDVQLRESFGPTHSAQVEAILALGRAPVTVGQLRTGLARVHRAGLVSDEDWWGQFKAQMSGLIEIRRGDENGMSGADARLAAAERKLALGDVTGALAQMQRLPPSAVRRASSWMRDAQRYASALQAVDALEAAILFPPSSAKPVAVPAPAMAPTL